MTDRLDDAIDRAVREMLDVEPRVDLRARVMAQLPTPGSLPPVSGFRLPTSGWVLGSIAAAAIIVLAVFLARRSAPVAPSAPAIARAVDRHLPPPVAPGPPPTPASGLGTPSRSVFALPVGRPPARRAARSGTVIAAAFPRDSATTTIDPLQTIAPITVAPVVQERIAQADITPQPLHAITEIQIAPLTPSGRRH